MSVSVVKLRPNRKEYGRIVGISGDYNHPSAFFIAYEKGMVERVT